MATTDFGDDFDPVEETALDVAAEEAAKPEPLDVTALAIRKANARAVPRGTVAKPTGKPE